MVGRGLHLGERANGGFFLEMAVGWRGAVWPVGLLVSKWTSAVPPLPHHEFTHPLQLRTWRVFLSLCV